MRLAQLAILAWMAAAAGCAAPQPGFMRKMTLVRADGKQVAIPEEKLSPFQRLVRSRMTGVAAVSVVALETDEPEGTGSDGAYMAVVRTGNAAELWYVEQEQHLPRTDRFYRRKLSGEESDALNDFLKRHPMTSIQTQVAAIVPVAVEMPASRPAETAPAQSQPAGLPENMQTEMVKLLPTAMRFWNADGKAAQMVEAQGPLGNNTAIGELAEMFAGFGNREGFTCSYVQMIPPSSRVLYADPHRAVMTIWTEGDEVRAQIADRSAQDEGKWFALKAGKWEAAQSPIATSAPATQASTEPATEPATEPVASSPATEPAATGPATTPATSPFSNPGILSTEESWWTEPGETFTTVWHYFPLSETNSRRLGFVVPTFVFDDEHAAINVAQRTLYILHDGQLIALPIPAAAFGGR